MYHVNSRHVGNDDYKSLGIITFISIVPINFEFLLSYSKNSVNQRGCGLE